VRELEVAAGGERLEEPELLVGSAPAVSMTKDTHQLRQPVQAEARISRGCSQPHIPVVVVVGATVGCSVALTAR
jgi:hypothetical protein